MLSNEGTKCLPTVGNPLPIQKTSYPQKMYPPKHRRESLKKRALKSQDILKTAMASVIVLNTLEYHQYATCATQKANPIHRIPAA